MNKRILKTISALFILIGITISVYADELKPSDSHQFNFFSGVFDYSHEGKNSELFGIQHSNENLFRDTAFGKISPITGFMMTADSATYLYTGVQAEYEIGKLNFTPSFSPGYYTTGDGKDLGSPLEFKTEVQFSIDTSSDSKIGFSYNHVSNASLGDKNPGANSYIFNFFKRF